MNDLARRKLGEIVTKYGRSIADDPRRLRALLADLCPGLTREVHVLVSAVDCGVVRDLTGSGAGQPWVLLSGRLTRRLMDQTAIADEAARWAVEAWGLALGVAPAQPARKNAVVPPPVPQTARPQRTPPPPPPVPVQVYPTPVPVQVYPIRREPPRPLLRRPVILVLIFTVVVLGVLTAIFRPFWGRQKPEGEVAPTPFDTELALLPGDCQFLVSVDVAGLTRSMGGVTFEKAAELFEDAKAAREIAEMSEQFQALFGKPLETLQRVTLFGIEGENKNTPLPALTLTFAAPLDAAAVERGWSEGVSRAGYPLVERREKKLVQQRAYWLHRKNALCLPIAADWHPPSTDKGAPAAVQADQACYFGDQPAIEKLLGPNRSHLSPGRLTTLLGRTDFKKALVAGWVGRDSLQALRNNILKPGAEEKQKQVAAILDGAEEAVGRLDLRDDHPCINLVVTYATDTNARQAEETVRALAREAQDAWNKEGRKKMVDELARKNDRLRPRSETFLGTLEQGLSFTVTRDGRTLDVSLRLDRSPVTVLTEMASLDRTINRETDEETRRRLPELTDAAKKYKTLYGSWPPDLSAIRDAKAGLLNKDALQSTWELWKYDAAGLHHQKLEPDIWLVTPQGKLICNWDSAGGLNNQPEDFVVHLEDVASKTSKYYTLPGAREAVTIDQVREALKQHTSRHPPSTILRLVVKDKSHGWSQPAWSIRYLAEANGYQIVEQVTGPGAQAK